MVTDQSTTKRLSELFHDNTPKYELVTVPAQQFIVDRHFQRHLTKNVVDAITRNFVPAALGVIYANHRDNDTIVVIDGQHRVEALLQLRQYNYATPTLLYQRLTIAQEAALFRFFNANRNRPTPLEIYRADLVAGDPEALAVDEILRAYGIHVNYELVNIMSKPLLLSAIGTIRIIYRRGGAQVLHEVLSVLASAWGDRGGGLSARYLKALYAFIRRYDGEYEREQLITSLHETPLIALQRLGLTYGEEYSISATTAIARAIRTNYNRGLRGSRQLTEWSTDDSMRAAIPDNVGDFWTEQRD